MKKLLLLTLLFSLSMNAQRINGRSVLQGNNLGVYGLSSYAYNLNGRTDNLFPVPCFKPYFNNSVLAMDLFPSGTFTESGGNGITWFDACDNDTNLAMMATARLGITYDYGYTGTIHYGSVKPFCIVVGGSSDNVVMRFEANRRSVHGDNSSDSYNSFYWNNPNEGTAAASRIYAFNGASHIGLYSFGINFTSSGMRIGGNVAVLTDASANMDVGTEGNKTLTFWTNSTIRMTVKGSGVINLSGVPTSSVGLVTDDIYVDALGFIKKVP